MNTPTTSRKWYKPLAPVLIGVAIGGFLSWSIWHERPLAPCPGPAMIAYFDEASVNTLGQLAGSVGARFYYAANAPGDKRAIAAPIDAEGMHIPEEGVTKFRLYKSLDGTRTELELLDEPTAEKRVKQSMYDERPAWSIDCPKEKLNGLTGVAGSNGIGLAVLRMADGSNTFQLVPVEIANGHASMVGSYSDMVTAEPCPNFCGEPPTYYLHRRP